MVVLFARDARADPHTVCMHIDLENGLIDTSPDDGEFFEDHGRSDAGAMPWDLQGWLVRVVDPDTGVILGGWAPLDAGGCITFEGWDPMTGPDDVAVIYYPWAFWPGPDNGIVAYDCDNTRRCEWETATETVTLDTGGETHFEIPNPVGTGGPQRPWEVALWSASFAEEQASYREGQTIYVATDPTGSVLTSTSANVLIGSRPTVQIKGSAYGSKFTVGHEYGHAQTQFTAIHGFGSSDIDCTLPDMVDTHLFGAKEWQSCAMLEGFAHFYSISVWNDLVPSESGSLGYAILNPSGAAQAQTIGSFVTCAYDTMALDTDPTSCADGQAVERDWASALVGLRRDGAAPMQTIVDMVEIAYPWTTSGQSSSFWNGFTSSVQAHLGSDYADFLGAAATWEIDQ